jgi:LysM repeat protein
VPNNAVSAVAPVSQHNDIAYTPANAVAASPPPDYTEYDVKKGDSLWKIAKEHYGLTDDKAIQDAVDKIAFTNGKGQGTDANRIHPGETLRIPDSPVKGENDSTLNWKALDAEVKAGTVFRQHFGNAAHAVTPENVPVPAFRADALTI